MNSLIIDLHKNKIKDYIRLIYGISNTFAVKKLGKKDKFCIDLV